MTKQLDSSIVEQIFARAGISSASISSSPFLLIASDRPSIVWANGPAVALLGAAHEREASRRLFRPGPSSQALVNRLRRMATDPEPRLERLMIARGFQLTPKTVACRTVEGVAAEPLILLQFLEATMVETEASPRFESALTAEPGPTSDAVLQRMRPAGPASLAEVARDLEERFNGKRVLRVLWETDQAGVVTQVGDGFASALGNTALQLGDDLVHRVGELDEHASAAVAAALRERRTLTGLQVTWPVAASATVVPVTLGCVFRSGSVPGLRGFCQIHIDQVTAHGRADAEPGVNDFAGTASPAADGSIGPSTADSEGPAASEPEASPGHAPGATMAAPRSLVLPVTGTAEGNIVHFPGVKPNGAGAPPAAEQRTPDSHGPTPEPGSDAPVADFAPPLWSESPGGTAAEPGQLSVDEQDAFDHIRKVLGTRPVAETRAGPSETLAAAAATPERSGSAEPSTEFARSLDTIITLLDALPTSVMLHRNADLLHANRALLNRLGLATFEAMRAQADGRPPEGEATAFRPEEDDHQAGPVWDNGQPTGGEPRTIVIGDAVLTLTSFPDERRASDDEGLVETLRRETQAQRTSLAEKEAALAFSADGVGFVDDQGWIIAATPGAERLFGYETGEIVGRSGASLLMADQEASWRALLASGADASVSRAAASELLGRTRTGSLVPLQVRVGRVAPGRFCVVWSDDSSRKRAENGLEAARREAERANTLKSEFLAKVSHEIRTPLNAILGFAEVIMDERLGPVGNARYVDYLKDIHASGTHVMSLVNDLLDLSRIEAGGLDLKLEAVDVNAVVGTCVNTLQTQAHRERVIVRLSLATRLPPALADERSLRQIVLNLLSNAIKFNEPGGQVIVSTAVTDAETIAIRIRDTGLGMSDDEIETAMEPFRQLQTEKSSGGSGLGLPLTKALIEASCASMTIKSRRGEGTLVEVLFPIVEQETLSVLAQ